jgi:uncharacterized protein
VVDSDDFLKITRLAFSELAAKLAPKYSYHSLSHTTMVMRDALFLAHKMGISEQNIRLLATAICFHDFGFVSGHVNHEEQGCNVVRELLPQYNYRTDEIDVICGMIMATKIPQSPKTQLEKIICDADLFYLGTAYYFQIAHLFQRELTALGVLKTKKQWTEIQVTFLRNHHYHTTIAQQLLEKTKQNNLAIIECCDKT